MSIQRVRKDVALLGKLVIVRVCKDVTLRGELGKCL
jgi:hypothetical protein